MLFGGLMVLIGVAVANKTASPTTINKIGKQKIKGDDGSIDTTFEKPEKPKKKRKFRISLRRKKRK